MIHLLPRHGLPDMCKNEGPHILELILKVLQFVRSKVWGGCNTTVKCGDPPRKLVAPRANINDGGELAVNLHHSAYARCRCVHMRICKSCKHR